MATWLKVIGKSTITPNMHNTQKMLWVDKKYSEQGFTQLVFKKHSFSFQ